MSKTWIICNQRIEKVPENNGFEEGEEDEVDIDDEFEDIEEENVSTLNQNNMLNSCCTS